MPERSRMTLFWSSRSPFVRKVMVMAHETGVVDLIDTRRVLVGAARHRHGNADGCRQLLAAAPGLGREGLVALLAGTPQ